MKHSLMICLAVTLTALPASGEILEHIVYTPTSLPSAQGWTYHGSNLDEDDVFSVVDGVLVMDTMGKPMASNIEALYSFDTGDHPDARGAVVRWRARITDSEHMPHTYHHGFGFSGWPLDGWVDWYWFSLDPETLYTANLPTLDLDTAVWRNYYLACTIDETDMVTSLLIDGEPTTFPADAYDGALSSAVVFGDRGWHANARVEIAEIEIILTTTPPVPTQSTTLSTLRSLFTP